MPVAMVRLDPLGPLFLRPPSPFTAGVFGPGALGSSLSYPMPSTIAGLLAFQVYKDEERCGESGRAEGFPEYGDQIECLQRLAGLGARLLTGLLLSNSGAWHAYQNTDRFPRLDEIARSAARTVETECPTKPEGDQVRAVRERRTGIALERRSKSVARSYLYSMERVAYKPRSTIVALLSGEHAPALKATVKVGGKGGLARLETRETRGIELANAAPGRYAAVLISPALLWESPYPGGEPAIVSNEVSRRRLAERLLAEAGVTGTGVALVVPKGEWMLEALTPGWSLAGNKPRRPMLVVPPGTVLRLDLEAPLDAVRLGEDLFLAGFGCCNRLGWGTALVVPL